MTAFNYDEKRNKGVSRREGREIAMKSERVLSSVSGTQRVSTRLTCSHLRQCTTLTVQQQTTVSPDCAVDIGIILYEGYLRTN